MRVFGYDLTLARTRSGAGGVPVSSPGGWFSVIRESFTGAWQQNVEVSGQTAHTNPTVYSCITQITQSISKMRLRLVELTSEGTWKETSSPAFSPVLRRPNRYQLIHEFVEYWVASKVQWGNTYVLKSRDARGVVVALDILNPPQVTVLEAPDGAIYYQLQPNVLAGVPPEGITVPASEIIHDKLTPLRHPLVGLSPIVAAALAATQGLRIIDNSTSFFANGSTPGGIITVPTEISKETAQRLKDDWSNNYGGVNAGKTALLTAGMKYETTTVNAVDAQLIEQLKWTEQVICGCYKVPMSLINSSPVPYANNEPLVLQFYSQCLQTYIVALENCLDDGLGLTSVPGHTYGTEFDIDDLLWMDTTSRTQAATAAVSGGVLSPNEARYKYFGLGSTPGGEHVYMQQQQWPLVDLSTREVPAPKVEAPVVVPTVVETEDEDDEALVDAG